MTLYQQLQTLEVECFKNPYGAEQINSILNNSNYLILFINEFYQIVNIAEKNDFSAIGYLVAFQQESDNLSELHRIGTLPKFRGLKYADSLLTNYFSICKNNKIYRLLLEVASKNVSARRLYQKSGYRNMGQRNNYYPNGDSAIIYEKMIR